MSTNLKSKKENWTGEVGVLLRGGRKEEIFSLFEVASFPQTVTCQLMMIMQSVSRQPGRGTERHVLHRHLSKLLL